MTLRTRLFLLFGSFVAVLVLGQWWLLQSLSRDLGKETESLAMSVGASVAQVLTVDLDCETGEDCLGQLDVTAIPPGSDSLDGRHQEDHTVFWHQDGSPERIRELLAERLKDPEKAERLIRFLDQHGNPLDPAPFGEHSGQTIVRLKVVETRDGETSEEIHRELIQGPADHDVRMHVGHDSGARVLFVERPDFIAEVPIPDREQPLTVFRRRLLLGSGAFALVGLLLAAFLADRVSAPLRRLSTAAAKVGDGALGTQVDERSGDKEIRGTLEAFNQMSARLAELESETRRLEAVRHMGEMGDVARGLAHTLRNPLNALGLSVEELAGPQGSISRDPTDRSALVETARRQIRRIDSGIRSFLLLASQGGDSDEVAVEQVDVAALVEDVALEALQNVSGSVRLHVTIDEHLDARRRAVEPELRAAIQALVVNALEADPEGETVQVRLLGSPESNERLILRVEDRGPGLPAHIRKHLFTPHLSTKPNGSGMGLFLAHRIATHRYDGRLELIDREQGGLRAELEIGHRRPLQSESQKESLP